MPTELPIWVIYDKPTDYPDVLVARKWLLDQPTNEVITAATLDDLREKLPPGLAQLSRHPSDDPKIVESWI